MERGIRAGENVVNDDTGKLWAVAKLPVQILLIGLSILLLLWISSRFYVPAFHAIAAALNSGTTSAEHPDHPVLQTIVSLLILIVGLSFAGFLWWVVGRYFALISSGKMTAEQLSDLKDLPMGLPEGSVRSVLALIVAVVGLPLLAFSKVIALDPAIGGYLNGIITGVFGFYFGTRSASVSNQAINQIASAKSRADQAEDDRDQAQASQDQAAAAKLGVDSNVIYAIACQETASIWLAWIDKMSPAQVLAGCVFDSSGDAPPGVRQAFPKNTADFRSRFGDAITQQLIDAANAARALRGYGPRPWVYKGYGIFQYDMRACLDRFTEIFAEKLGRSGGNLPDAVRAYNGSGPAVDRYVAAVMQMRAWCQ